MRYEVEERASGWSGQIDEIEDTPRDRSPNQFQYSIPVPILPLVQSEQMPYRAAQLSASGPISL